jgi:hypothetical protein
MGSLTVGMIGAWIAISAYVGWLGFQQSRIGRQLNAMKQIAESRQNRKTESPTADARSVEHASRAA